MTKRIWFKSDCIDWIRSGKKTTTWRSQKHNGEYIIVKGSRFKAVPIKPKLIIKLTPFTELNEADILAFWNTEGGFENEDEFDNWLTVNHLCNNAKNGWLHKIEVLR